MSPLSNEQVHQILRETAPSPARPPIRPAPDDPADAYDFVGSESDVESEPFEIELDEPSPVVDDDGDVVDSEPHPSAADESMPFEFLPVGEQRATRNVEATRNVTRNGQEQLVRGDDASGKKQSERHGSFLVATEEKRRGSFLVAPAPGERTSWLQEVGRSLSTAEACADALGVERSRLRDGENGVWGTFVDERLEAGGARFVFLAELRGLLAGVKSVPEPSVGRWQVRLLYEAGLVELPPDPLLPVGNSVVPHIGAVRDGLALLFRCRHFLHDDDPLTFSLAFGTAWAGVRDFRHVSKALKELERIGVILRAGELRYGGRQYPSTLWLPGQGKP